MPELRNPVLGQAPKDLGPLMRAAWWWIDRWRRSTARTDMNLAERGAYRELLDECWLREGVIPDDEEVLIRICACTPEEWARIRGKVLARFKKCPGGLHNETADEVMRESNRRADKQKTYRSRKRAGNTAGNARGNATGNGDGNNLGSPSPSPSPSQETDVVGGQVVRSSPPAYPPEQRAENATKDTIHGLQLRLGGLLCRLSEHENSRLMVPAWSEKVTSYENDGRKVRGRQDYRMIRSPERLQRSIEDAEDWLKSLEAGKVVDK